MVERLRKYNYNCIFLVKNNNDKPYSPDNRCYKQTGIGNIKPEI